MRLITPLNGAGWRLGALPAQRFASLPVDLQWPEGTEWFPAQVPGNVRADLHRAGRIPDPHLDPSAGAWVDRYPCCLRPSLSRAFNRVSVSTWVSRG